MQYDLTNFVIVLDFMKIATHIFIIYMLALALVPCGDGGGGITEIIRYFTEEEHLFMSDHEQHSNSCGDDTCSPFCICSCCSSVMDTPIKLHFQITPKTAIPSNTPSFFININPSSFFAAIWQPPKLS